MSRAPPGLSPTTVAWAARDTVEYRVKHDDNWYRHERGDHDECVKTGIGLIVLNLP